MHHGNTDIKRETRPWLADDSQLINEMEYKAAGKCGARLPGAQRWQLKQPHGGSIPENLFHRSEKTLMPSSIEDININGPFGTNGTEPRMNVN